jgi:DNA-binding Xre family transcriptional regulator
MDTKQQIADLIKRVRQLEERVFGLETVGKPKYGLTNERAELPIHIVMPSLHDLDFKKLRKAKGLTLREVEKETGISNAYLSQLETGKIKSPGYSTVIALYNLYCNGAQRNINLLGLFT